MPFDNINPSRDYTPKHHPKFVNHDSRVESRHRHASNNKNISHQSLTSRAKGNISSQDRYHDKNNLDNSKQKSEDPKRPKKEYKDQFHDSNDDYFSQSLDDDVVCGKSHAETSSNNHDAQEVDDDDDPLDAYMKTLDGGDDDATTDTASEQKVKVDSDEVSIVYSSQKPPNQSLSSNKPSSKERGIRLDIDVDVDVGEEVFLTNLQRTISEEESYSQDEESEQQHDVEYDEEDNIIGFRKTKRDIEPLAAVDHSAINYESFVRNFYNEHPEIAKLTQEQGEQLRAKLEIKVTGESAPKPVCSFAHFNFDEQLMRVIRRSDYTQPTPIQAQAIPVALMGRNLIGIAQTGSGKTAAYLWPMIEHIMGQPDLKQGDGPIGLVLVPTRELALQVYGQAKKFSNSYNIAVVCAYGGGSKYEQSQDLEAGAEIVIATPGRLIDLIKLNATNLRRVTYFVLDEADRFFDMGFEIQVKSICEQVRPDRQTLLFSATFKHKTEQLARRFLDNPIKIVQKTLGEANEDVTQHVITLKEGPGKWNWLLERLVEFTSTGSVLIFVTRISHSEELHKNLLDEGKETLLLHGDMEQSERNRVITSFKRKEKNILIATDVAARGLDISHIRTVINYDVARDIDTHIHRIGRTGRAGNKGDAFTLITDKDKDFAGHLVKNLETFNQKVNDDLLNIAMQSYTFRKSRQAASKNQSHNKHSHQYNRDHRDHHKHYKNQDISNRVHVGHNNDAGPSSKSYHEHQSKHKHYRPDDRKRARMN